MDNQLTINFEFDELPVLPGKIKNPCMPLKIRDNLDFECLPNCMGYHRTCMCSFDYDIKRELY